MMNYPLAGKKESLRMVKSFMQSKCLCLTIAIQPAFSHTTQTTQWTHPKTGKKKRLAGELPFGWEKTADEDGAVLFIE